LKLEPATEVALMQSEMAEDTVPHQELQSEKEADLLRQDEQASKSQEFATHQREAETDISAYRYLLDDDEEEDEADELFKGKNELKNEIEAAKLELQTPQDISVNLAEDEQKDLATGAVEVGVSLYDEKQTEFDEQVLKNQRHLYEQFMKDSDMVFG
jgi:hypothetical protein